MFLKKLFYFLSIIVFLLVLASVFPPKSLAGACNSGLGESCRTSCSNKTSNYNTCSMPNSCCNSAYNPCANSSFHGQICGGDGYLYYCDGSYGTTNRAYCSYGCQNNGIYSDTCKSACSNYPGGYCSSSGCSSSGSIPSGYGCSPTSYACCYPAPTATPTPTPYPSCTDQGGSCSSTGCGTGDQSLPNFSGCMPGSSCCKHIPVCGDTQGEYCSSSGCPSGISTTNTCSMPQQCCKPVVLPSCTSQGGTCGSPTGGCSSGDTLITNVTGCVSGASCCRHIPVCGDTPGEYCDTSCPGGISDTNTCSMPDQCCKLPPCAGPTNVCVANGNTLCPQDIAAFVRGACNTGSTCCGPMASTQFDVNVNFCSKSASSQYWNIHASLPAGNWSGDPSCPTLQASNNPIVLTAGTTSGCPSGTRAYGTGNFYDASGNRPDYCNIGGQTGTAPPSPITVTWDNGYSSGVAAAGFINQSDYTQGIPAPNLYGAFVDVSYNAPPVCTAPDAPTNLGIDGNSLDTTSHVVSAGAHNITWTAPVSGADHYIVVVDDKVNGLAGTNGLNGNACATQNAGDSCAVSGYGYSFTLLAGHTYNIYVYSVSSAACGNLVSAAALTNVGGPVPPAPLCTDPHGICSGSYSISGFVYSDNDKSHDYSSSKDSIYAGSPLQINVCNGVNWTNCQIFNTSGGNFDTGVVFPAGEYRVSLVQPPSGNVYSGNSSFQVIVGK